MKKFLTGCLAGIANTAVKTAESALSSSDGKAKKEFAVAFIINSLNIPCVLKPLVIKLVSEAIDDAIEFALMRINKEE